LEFTPKGVGGGRMKLSIQEGMIPGNTLEEKFKLALRFGFEGIEFSGDKLREDKEKVKKIKKVASKSKVKPSTICSGFRGSLLSNKKEERELAVCDIKELLSIGQELGVVGLVLVPIFGGPKIPDLSPLYSTWELEKKMFIEQLYELGKHLKQVDQILLIEPLNRYETHFINRLEQAVEICKVADNPQIRIMADFFHMNIEERDVAESIEKAKDFICHVHLADSNRLLPGQGHTDFAGSFAALKRIGFKDYMALECGISGKKEEELPKCVKYLNTMLDVRC